MTDGEQLAGDDAFDEFYRVSYARLVGQLFAVVGDLPQAEDVVQEAFVRALARWSTIQKYEQPEAWVRRVALNLTASNFRRLRRELAARLRLRQQRLTPTLAPETSAVLEILRHVPLNQRTVLMLHDIVDLPIEDIATQLGLPVTTVRGRLARARATLRRKLEDDNERLATRA
jgi:RNA polymerase sigma-70 factor (ECF subfamily)